MSLQSTIEVAQKTKQYDHLFVQVREQVGSMQRLLDTLTLLTRLQSAPDIHLQNIALTPLLTQLVTTAQQTYPDSIFTSTSAPDLTITWDAGILERIVTNLLDNAGKFTPPGGTITVHADAHHLRITDTGYGIAPQDLSHIREPFRQGDAARNTSWFGLGLRLVQQLVAVMKWKISVTSELGKGTTFMIHR